MEVVLVRKVSFCQQYVLVVIPPSEFPLGLAACHLPQGESLCCGKCCLASVNSPRLWGASGLCYSGNVFVAVIITEGQAFMGFYDHILNPDFVPLPGNVCDPVCHSVSCQMAVQDAKCT